jgi:hypothetical protein
MTRDEAEAGKELAQRRKARKNLIPFIQYTKPDFIKEKYHDYIAEKLEAVERGEIKRLMIFAPRRHTKSEIASRRFPAWYLARNPNKQIITVSYGSDTATDFGRDVRNILISVPFMNLTRKRPFYPTRVSMDSSAANRFSTNMNGIYVSTSIDGTATGRGADILIIDDPHKNAIEALDTSMQEKIFRNYKDTLRPTLMPDGAIVLIMSKWGMGDLASRILEQAKETKEEWVIVRLPVFAEKDDPIGRQVGEVLSPNRVSKEFLENQRLTMGEDSFDAQMQQIEKPKVIGAIFHQEQIDRDRVAAAPEMVKVVISIDPSATSKLTSDEAGITAVGKGKDGHGYLLGDYSGILSPTGWAKTGLSAYDRHEANEIVGEANNGGDMVKTIINSNRPEVKVVLVWASRGKMRRAEPVSNLYAQHRIHHVGRFRQLEDEITTYSGIEGEKSPNRLDSMVWGFTCLFDLDNKEREAEVETRLRILR